MYLSHKSIMHFSFDGELNEICPEEFIPTQPETIVSGGTEEQIRVFD